MKGISVAPSSGCLGGYDFWAALLKGGVNEFDPE
jgi:hypothetical protein